MTLRASRLVVFIFCALGGCSQGVSASRDRLTALQAGWERSLQTLEQQQAALAGRFGGSAANASPNSGALQIRAVLDGAQQSLRDINVQIQQVPDHVAIFGAVEPVQRSVSGVWMESRVFV